jgi:hypothetical protein
MSDKKRDRWILNKLVRSPGMKKISGGPKSRETAEIGQLLIGTPYLAGTLEREGTERLVVNLREFDCVTFVENVVAIAWFLRSKERSFESFQRLLQKIRYRRGRLQGYSSRFHYFSEWIQDNGKKGILKDVTRKIGGRAIRKTINFMTTHPHLYLSLREAVNLRKMKSVEKRISTRPFFSVPKKALRHFEDRIQDGDLIAITTNRKGLDVQHVGHAATVKNRIHLLHASSGEGSHFQKYTLPLSYEEQVAFGDYGGSDAP